MLVQYLSDPLVGLDPSKIHGQAYDGAAVMSSNRAGVQAKIKEFAPLALYTHCYSHCLNLSLASACKLQEVSNLIGVINETYLKKTDPRGSNFLSQQWRPTCPTIPTPSFQVCVKLDG